MTYEEKNEIIKAMAYGFTNEEVAEECEMTVEEVAAFRKEHAADIAKKAGESHE